jgi:hypothetical protein
MVSVTELVEVLILSLAVEQPVPAQASLHLGHQRLELKEAGLTSLSGPSLVIELSCEVVSCW